MLKIVITMAISTASINVLILTSFYPTCQNKQMNLVETRLISWSLFPRWRVKRQEKTWHCTRHRCSLSRYFCFTIYASPSQDDHRGFRRQLEDKRPVVENNLLSGRQYIANEPPLSDTSDSEGTLWITHKLYPFF